MTILGAAIKEDPKKRFYAVTTKEDALCSALRLVG
jgi:hypothetical protein